MKRLSLLAVLESIVAKSPTSEDYAEYGQALSKVNVPTPKKKKKRKSFEFRGIKKLNENVDESEIAKGVIENFGIPLIKKLIVRGYQLKICGHISQEFVNALNKNGIKSTVVDNGRHAVARIWINGKCFDIDLSYAQFLCNDLDNFDEVSHVVDKISQNPWETIKINRHPQFDEEINNG